MLVAPSSMQKLKKYIDRFRLVWTIDSVSQWQSDVVEVAEGIRSIQVVQMMNKIPEGWYMLELETNSDLRRVACKIYFNGAVVNDANVCWGFPLHSGRVNKRLVYVDSLGTLRFEMQKAGSDLELRHFRLLRVTQRFARSRMLIKLRALHPRFRSSWASFKLKGKDDFAESESMALLWDAYNLLFESAEVILYSNWLSEFGLPFTFLERGVASHSNNLPASLLISLILPVYNSNSEWLARAISSVIAQTYPHWQLCIADDASSDGHMRPLLERLAAADSRIKLVFREQNGHISAASNSAIDIATGDWLVLLDHDDELALDALSRIADAIQRRPDCQLIYSDEDKIDEAGTRSDPYFKPDWNPDLFLSQNMFSHLGAYRADLVRAVGGFRMGYEGSQDYDLALRCIERIRPDQIVHIPRVLYHWRIHEGSTAHAIEAKPYAMVAGERALNDHLRRTGVDATAEAVGYGYRVRYVLPAVPPLVSLIIPTRNGLKLLRQCVESIFEKTDYPHYEIIVVDNGSDDKATLRYLDALATRPNVRVMRDDRPFNYSALNNAAVAQARGEVVGLLNNDLEVISAGWLTELVSHALRPGVGAVGARLWYADDTLQHAGVVLGIHGIAGHVHRFLPRGDVGYCGRASLIQSFSALTGACLLVRKSVYEELGGLNETELQVACNDVDFCLRAREAGYKNIWTPYAELYHHESASRGFDDTPEKQARSAKEVAYMKMRWGEALLNDPAYNPNLTLDSEDFGLAWPPRVPSLDEVLSAAEQANQVPVITSAVAPPLQ